MCPAPAVGMVLARLSDGKEASEAVIWRAVERKERKVRAEVSGPGRGRSYEAPGTRAGALDTIPRANGNYRF